MKAQTTALSEGFEGPFPAAWSVSRSAGSAAASWGVQDIAVFGSPKPRPTGSHALYCAGSGYLGSSTTPFYRNSMDTYVSRGVDLTTFDTATLSFWYVIPSIEAGVLFDPVDGLHVSIDGTEIFLATTVQSTWAQVTLNLRAYTGGIHTLAFRFTSDGSVNSEGVYLDDIVVKGIALPDLTWNVFQVRTNRVHAGEVVSANGSVFNAANADAGPFRLGFYLASSTNAAQSRLVATVSESGCGAHKPSRFFPTIAIPPETLPGSYLLELKIDDLHEVDELNEFNNGPFSLPITVLPPPMPDLAVLSNRVNNLFPHEGETITLTLTVTNQPSLGGGAAAGAFKVGVYLSDSTSFTGSKASMEVAVPEVAKNGSLEIPIRFTIPDHLPSGIYYVGAKLDDLSEIGEGNEANNWSAPVFLFVQAGGRWTRLANDPPVAIARTHLLPDGTVLAQQGDTATSTNWYVLTPDRHGSYSNGTWSAAAPMKYSRVWYASAVLFDGRILLAGGEYGTGTTNAEVYDPRFNAWTEIPVPAGLITTNNVPDEKTGQNSAGFSDAISEVLPDGRIMIAPVYPVGSGSTVIFNPQSNTFAAGPHTFNRRDQNEVTWVKLADASILTVDKDSNTSERFIPALNRWIDDATLPVELYSEFGSEIGPGFLLPNAKAMFIGGNGHSAIYSPSGTTNVGTWQQGPEIPAGLGAPDAPAAMLPNGNVLCAFSPRHTNEVFQAPTWFYEYDYRANAFNAVSGPTGQKLDEATFSGQMLSLPDGSILFSHQSTNLYLYTRAGEPVPSAKPLISKIAANTNGSYHLEGTGLNGISEGAFYGDDAQMNSNFPMVRMTNTASGAMYYAFTHHWSSTGVMTGAKPVSTEFSLPDDLPGGEYNIVAVANGIASDPIPLSVPAGTGMRMVILNGTHGGHYVGCRPLDPGVILKTPHLHFQYTSNPFDSNPVWIPDPDTIVLDKGRGVLASPIPTGSTRKFYRVLTY